MCTTVASFQSGASSIPLLAAFSVYRQSQPIFSDFFFFLAILGLSCDLRDLVPWQWAKPRPPALGVWSLGHWIARETPIFCASEDRPMRSQCQRARAQATTMLCSGAYTGQMSTRVWHVASPSDLVWPSLWG